MVALATSPTPADADALFGQLRSLLPGETLVLSAPEGDPAELAILLWASLDKTLRREERVAGNDRIIAITRDGAVVVRLHLYFTMAQIEERERQIAARYRGEIDRVWLRSKALRELRAHHGHDTAVVDVDALRKAGL
jgi:hypothetical protein